MFWGSLLSPRRMLLLFERASVFSLRRARSPLHFLLLKREPKNLQNWTNCSKIISLSTDCSSLRRFSFWFWGGFASLTCLEEASGNLLLVSHQQFVNKRSWFCGSWQRDAAEPSAPQAASYSLMPLPPAPLVSFCWDLCFFFLFKGFWCCHQGFHLITERHQREMKRSTDSPFVPSGGTRLQSRRLFGFTLFWFLWCRLSEVAWEGEWRSGPEETRFLLWPKLLDIMARGQKIKEHNFFKGQSNGLDFSLCSGPLHYLHTT